MSLEELKAFLEKVKSDSNLQAKLKAAKSAEDVLCIAKEYGHVVSHLSLQQISDEDLKSISGGWDYSVIDSKNWNIFRLKNGMYGLDYSN